MKRLLIINNIVTPYRIFMFNKMYEKGNKLGIEVFVAFQARHYIDYSWKPEDFDMKFPHYISSGLFPSKQRQKDNFTFYTINCDIIKDVIYGYYDWIIMSPFMSLTTMILSIVPIRKTKLLLWFESNSDSSRYQQKFIQKLRSIIVKRYSALVCPGQRAIEYIYSFDPNSENKTIIYLPNIVDRSLFLNKINKYRKYKEKIRNTLGFSKTDLLILVIGRLVALKGHDLLIKAISKDIDKYKIIIVGNGPLKNYLKNLINQNNLSNRIKLVGQCSQEEVSKYLAIADWLIHPSIRDAAPLATVEAIIAGLPIVSSIQTGNAPEVINEDINGFTFNPLNTKQIINALNRISMTSRRKREAMSKASKKIAKERFDPDKVLSRFFINLMRIT